MKRMYMFLLALAAALALTVPARADLMWEPHSNHFFEQHREGCQYEDRGYLANGEAGFVTLWDTPGGSAVIAQYENGERLWIGYTYQGWGLTSRQVDGQEISGWVELAELAQIYDYRSFQAEYAGQIRDYAGEFAGYNGTDACVNFFAYPGAPEVMQTFQLSDWGADVIGNLTGTADDRSYIRSVFTDEAGRTWGFVSYMYGHLDGWFCLDDPDGTDFPLRQVEQVQLTPAQKPVLPAAGYAPYLLVGAAAAVTAALLAWFYARKRKK